MPFEILQELDPLTTVIKVIGVGGGGGNAVQHMIDHGAKGIEFIAANTDHQALVRSRAHINIQLGSTGLGAGARPEEGARAAEEKREQIADAIRGTNLLFITAGMGGGTGTGAAPVIAGIAKELGILTVAVVTKPFSFEGSRRMRVAEKGIENLKDKVDSMIVILNEKLETECPPNATMKECFEMSNEVLYKACVGIADIINTPGTINLDFNDLTTVMSERGTAIIGLATAKGPDRARVAAEKAIASPLLEGANLQGARGLLAYFTGDESVTLSEIKEAMELLKTFVNKSAVVIFGSAIVPEMGDEIRVTLVATGLDQPADAGDSQTAQKPVTHRPQVSAGDSGDMPTFEFPAFGGETEKAPAPEAGAEQKEAEAPKAEGGEAAPAEKATEAEPAPSAPAKEEPAAEAPAASFHIPTYLRK
jgi:cell division protein FtsZ